MFMQQTKSAQHTSSKFNPNASPATQVITKKLSASKIKINDKRLLQNSEQAQISMLDISSDPASQSMVLESRAHHHLLNSGIVNNLIGSQGSSYHGGSMIMQSSVESGSGSVVRNNDYLFQSHPSAPYNAQP